MPWACPASHGQFMVYKPGHPHSAAGTAFLPPGSAVKEVTTRARLGRGRRGGRTRHRYVQRPLTISRVCLRGRVRWTEAASEGRRLHNRAPGVGHWNATRCEANHRGHGRREPTSLSLLTDASQAFPERVESHFSAVKIVNII